MINFVVKSTDTTVKDIKSSFDPFRSFPDLIGESIKKLDFLVEPENDDNRNGVRNQVRQDEKSG